MKPRLKKFNKRNVSLSALILAVRAIAGAKPYFVYEPCSVGGLCQYNPTRLANGCYTGCLIGEALRRIGVTTTGLDANNGNAIATHLKRIGIETDTQQVRWLEAVQRRQDERDPWGKAVAYADQHYPLDRAA